MNKRNIIFISGTRADYGKMKSLMRAIDDSPDFELFIFVSGMHLLSIFGSTYEEIIKDGYKNVYVAFGLVHSESMSVNLGNTIAQFSGYVQSVKPDLIVVHGDRIDALAGAVVGALNNILVAHIEGGEVSGTIDESIRHAVSKFAHLHFVSNIEAQKRLIQLGENESNIFIIGSPDIDIMMSDKLPSLSEAKQRYGLSYPSYAIFMYHSVTTEYSKLPGRIREIVSAIIESNENFIVIYPNNDMGSEIILNEYKRFEGLERISIFPSLRFEHFLTLLKNADFMIGNSSAGVRETGVYGIPSIDIGSRQAGRYSLDICKNIQHVSENSNEILSAIGQIAKYRSSQSGFGDGDSTAKFLQVLKNDAIWNLHLQKVFVDLMEIL